jgi:diguanylate cyclase (GGDEF)-like protein
MLLAGTGMSGGIHFARQIVQIRVTGANPEFKSDMDRAFHKVKQARRFPHALEPVILALLAPLGAEGGAIITLEDRSGKAVVAYETSITPSSLLGDADLLVVASGGPVQGTCSDNHPILAGPWATPLAKRVVLAFWRAKGARPWRRQDHGLVATAAVALDTAVRFVGLEPREATHDGIIDNLTGLPKARKFAADLPRYFARLDREGLPGTLIVVNIDDLGNIRERHGRKIADEIIRQTARLLSRASRPTDIISRLGNDEFAIWLQGADHLTAAERAEQLRMVAPHAMAAVLGDAGPSVTLSVGIAARRPGSSESVRTLIMRADFAMHEARQAGRGLWRVAPDAVG